MKGPHRPEWAWPAPTWSSGMQSQRRPDQHQPQAPLLAHLPRARHGTHSPWKGSLESCLLLPQKQSHPLLTQPDVAVCQSQPRAVSPGAPTSSAADAHLHVCQCPPPRALMPTSVCQCPLLHMRTPTSHAPMPTSTRVLMPSVYADAHLHVLQCPPPRAPMPTSACASQFCLLKHLSDANCPARKTLSTRGLPGEALCDHLNIS